MKPLINVSIADEELEGLASGGEANGRQLSRLLDDELALFEAWMIKNLGGGASSHEKAIVKTYLYKKIVGDVDRLETTRIDVLGLARAQAG
jgi:hypothetical protein